MSKYFNFHDSLFEKTNSVLKYSIKNKKTESYIFFNPKMLSSFNNLINNATGYTVTDDTNSYNELINNVDRMIANKMLCIGLSRDEINEILNNNSHLILVIGENLPYGNIYGFCAITFKKKTYNTSYGHNEEQYIYADFICSHSNIQYAGDKLLTELFNIAKICNINKIKLESVESAVKFYEKYGFNKTRDGFVKYINKTPIDFQNIETYVYCTDSALNNIKEDDGYLESFDIPTSNVSNELIIELSTFLQNSTAFKEKNTDSAIKKITEYFDNSIVIVVKNIDLILGFALLVPSFSGNIFSPSIYLFFSNVEIFESDKIVLEEIEKYCNSLNAYYVKVFPSKLNIKFYEENGYKSIYKYDRYIYKKLTYLGGKKRKTKRKMTKRKMTKRKGKMSHNRRILI